MKKPNVQIMAVDKRAYKRLAEYYAHAAQKRAAARKKYPRGA
jgi:hypothetical protein